MWKQLETNWKAELSFLTELEIVEHIYSVNGKKSFHAEHFL